MTPLRLAACLLILFFAAVPPVPHPARAAGVSIDAPGVLDMEARELESIRALLLGSGKVGEAGSDPDYESLRRRALDVATRAETAVEELSGRLASMRTALDALGAATDGEPADLRSRRSDLIAERDTLQTTLKRARLLAVSARASVDLVDQAGASTFRRDAFERVAPPLSRRFWSELDAALPEDRARLAGQAAQARDRFVGAMSHRGGAILAAGLVVAFLLAFPLRKRLREMGRFHATHCAPETRARRSWLAVWSVVVDSSTTIAAAASVVQALL
ncbi:DUF3772 domain-containing protein [Aquibium microcysteis]|uniref:DUF3772 domain-containing protein n=1 Tax=Aquibium microcysteis TaxID=675281 RepID=UPI001AED7B6E|nr:DUF3772 domain-containing protein [Aquibium microcysteis]